MPAEEHKLLILRAIDAWNMALEEKWNRILR